MGQTRVKNKIHHAWFILAACCSFFGAMMGICSNCGGIFTPAICSDLGWSLSKLNSAGIVNGGTAILMLFVVDKIYRKYNTKLVLALMAFIYSGCYILRGLCHTYLDFVLVNIVMGGSSAFLFYVPVPMLINAWFEEKRGTAMGIAMLSSGIMGALFNPVLNHFILQNGWRVASFINGIIAMVVSVPMILLFIVRKPQDMGLLPYGAREKEAAEEETSGSNRVVNHEARDYVRIPVSEKKKKFKFCFVLSIITLVVSITPGNLPYFAAEIGLSSTTGAALLSASLFGNMASKFILGIVSDKFGPRTTWLCSITIVIPALFILLNKSAPLALLFAAAFINGTTAANNTMVVPSIISTFSSGEEYAKFISRCSIGTMIASTFGGTIVSLIHDSCGSFYPVFVLFIVLSLISIGIILYLLPAKKAAKAAL
ncbi:MAG: MFS transporter [Eubacteriales bacterium]|nr:MFS transporter [Eubacteriales bacterium]